MEIKNQFALMLGKNFSTLEKDGVFLEYAKGIIPNQIGKEYYITNKNKGIGFVLDEARNLFAIHFYGAGKDSSVSFQGDLPFNVYFEDSELTIRDKLGEHESTSGGGNKTVLLGQMNRWTRYNFPGKYLRFEFEDNGMLVLVTLGVAG